MKIAIIQHFRVPYQMAGSEVAMHMLGKALMAAGHEVLQITTDTPQAKPFEIYDGIKSYYVGRKNAEITGMLIKSKPDFILSHHQRAETAVLVSKNLRIPMGFYMHNDFAHNRKILRYRPELVIFNTEWIRDQYPGHRNIVVHPPVFQQECLSVAGDRVTLVNLNAHKGGEIFYQLAKMLPDIPFLGVVGGHGSQIVLNTLPNVEIQPHTTNMCGDVWNRTAVLLVPSIYESYGMVGLEAASLGIPVLAAPTPGLKESLGSGGWFIPRDNISEYADAIKSLMYDSRLYEEMSMRVKERFSQINAAGELATFVKTVEELCR